MQTFFTLPVTSGVLCSLCCGCRLRGSRCCRGAAFATGSECIMMPRGSELHCWSSGLKLLIIRGCPLPVDVQHPSIPTSMKPFNKGLRQRLQAQPPRPSGWVGVGFEIVLLVPRSDLVEAIPSRLAAQACASAEHNCGLKSCRRSKWLWFWRADGGC